MNYRQLSTTDTNIVDHTVLIPAALSVGSTEATDFVMYTTVSDNNCTSFSQRGITKVSEYTLRTQVALH